MLKPGLGANTAANSGENRRFGKELDLSVSPLMVLVHVPAVKHRRHLTHGRILRVQELLGSMWCIGTAAHWTTVVTRTLTCFLACQEGTKIL